MTEAAAMTAHPAAIVEMIASGEIVLDFALPQQTGGVLSLLRRYADNGMDLADACIVRITELTRDCRVITVDRRDFDIYRRNGREKIPMVAPPERS